METAKNWMETHEFRGFGKLKLDDTFVNSHLYKGKRNDEYWTLVTERLQNAYDKWDTIDPRNQQYVLTKISMTRLK